jgi:Fe2+ or Zn2+ uptake regulation protein
MDKSALLNFLSRARKKAAQGSLDIEAQNAIISELERAGLDATKAKALLAKLLATQDVDFAEMERLLDEMDNHSDGAS